MKDGQRQGPYQLFRLTEMLEDGELTPKDPVWHEGMEKWQALEDTESLRGVMRQPVVAKESGDHPQTSPIQESKPAAVIPELTVALLRQRRALAWRRLFARQIDLTIATVTTVMAAAAMGWSDLWSLFKPDSLAIILAPAMIWILVDTIMLSLLGWTPGRLLLGLRVVDKNGARPSARTALKRSALLWAGGLGFGLPAAWLLPLAQWAYAFWLFQQRGETLWDHSAGTRVIVCQLNRWHAVGLAVITAGVTSLFAWLCFAAPLPARLNDQDRAQFEALRNAALESAAPSRNKSGLPFGPGA